MDASLPDLRRRLEDEGRRRKAAEQERDEFAGFALAGQAAAGLAHELNNLLNTIVLQASVLQLQVDEKFHPALDVIRKQANASTGLLRTLSQVSGDRVKRFYSVDLVRAVQEVLAEEPALGARICWASPGQPLPTFRGIYSGLKQVVRLLLKAAAGESSSLQVRACCDGPGVQLVIECNEDLTASNDCGLLWSRLGELEQLAGQSLLRQMDGELQMAPRPDGGFIVRASWRPCNG